MDTVGRKVVMKLVDQGNTFQKDKSSSSDSQVSFYKCDLVRSHDCRARIHVKEGKVIMRVGSHNHPPTQKDSMNAKGTKIVKRLVWKKVVNAQDVKSPKKMSCLFCDFEGDFFGEEYQQKSYVQHLTNVHKVKYGLIDILMRTKSKPVVNQLEAAKPQQLPWFFGSEYQCRFDDGSCNQPTFRCEESLQNHIRSHHCGATLKKYLEKYGSYGTKTVFFKCKECGEEMKRSHANILKHLTHKHAGMIMEDYEEKHFSLTRYYRDNDSMPSSYNEESFREWKNKCVYECRECLLCFKKRPHFANHLMKLHDMTLATYEAKCGTVYRRVFLHQCKICHVKVYHTWQKLQKHFSTLHKLTVKKYYEEQISQGQKGSTTTFAHFVNGCRYKCKVCSKVCHTKMGLLAHITKTHDLKVAEYMDQYGPVSILLPRHRCLICDQNVIQNDRNLTLHMDGQHQITTREYFDKFIGWKHERKREEEKLLLEPECEVKVKCDVPEVKVKCDVPEVNVKPKKKRGKEITEHRTKREKGSRFKPGDVESLPWFAGCEYRCQYEDCQQLFYCPDNLKIHIHRAHCKLNKYVKMYGDCYETKAVFMECEECGEEIKRAFSYIHKHLIEKHDRMSLEDYAKKHFRRERITYLTKSTKASHRCVLCTTICQWDFLTLSRHMLLKHQISLQDYAVQAGMMTDLTVEDRFLAWKNQCIYECKICPNYFYYCEAMDNHLMYAHNMLQATYKDKFGTPLHKHVMHQCRLCLRSMDHESGKLQRHMRLMHDMTLEFYYFQHIEQKKQVPDTTGVNRSAADPTVRSSFWNKWQIKCKLCSKFLNSASGFNQHLNRKHPDITSAEYEAKYGKVDFKTLVHTCTICGCKIFQTENKLAQHVEAHGYSSQNYFKMWAKANQDNLKNIDNTQKEELAAEESSSSQISAIESIFIKEEPLELDL